MWTQSVERKSLGLNIKAATVNPNEIAKAIHDKVSRKSFDKTKFALLTEDENSWEVPLYIREGLTWLKDEIQTEELIVDEIQTEELPIEEIAEVLHAVIDLEGTSA